MMTESCSATDLLKRVAIRRLRSWAKRLLRPRCVALATAMLSLPLAAHAHPVTYDFAWTGNGGYAMAGYFSFDSADAADGAVRDGEVANLFFEGFVTGTSFESNATAPSEAAFNFNFDAATGQFFLGGRNDSDNGQDWSGNGGGLGFGTGLAGSYVSLGGIALGSVLNPVPLVATLRTPTMDVPEPATLAMVTLSLGVLGLQSTRRRRVPGAGRKGALPGWSSAQQISPLGRCLCLPFGTRRATSTVVRLSTLYRREHP